MFITPAYAQGAGGGGFDPGLIIMMVAIFAIFYFLIIRPQRKQMREREEMLKAIRRNDSVVTNGGLIGKVTKVVDDSEVEVQIARSSFLQLSIVISYYKLFDHPIKNQNKAIDKRIHYLILLP